MQPKIYGHIELIWLYILSLIHQKNVYLTDLQASYNQCTMFIMNNLNKGKYWQTELLFSLQYPLLATKAWHKKNQCTITE